jgi:hypothetical protein
LLSKKQEKDKIVGTHECQIGKSQKEEKIFLKKYSGQLRQKEHTKTFFWKFINFKKKKKVIKFVDDEVWPYSFK